MAQEAREEGFEDLAEKFEGVAKVEAAHERRYKKLLESYKADKTFKGDAPLGWKCRNCGYVHEAEEAPKSVRYALILRHTLKEKLKIINPHLMNSYCYSGRPVWASCFCMKKYYSLLLLEALWCKMEI